MYPFLQNIKIMSMDVPNFYKTKIMPMAVPH